ncbi:MAG: TldD/PmbA family protein, partial [Candidatus Krumholzibacteria bacterium]|nr:TldD/PmbA family protein [Candidatus Krumholzibacteria bacterium]
MLRPPTCPVPPGIAEALELAVSRGAEFAEIFLESTSSRTIRCEDGRIEKVESGADGGFGLRLVSGDRTAYGFSTETGRGAMMGAVDAVAGDLGAAGDGCFSPPRELRSAGPGARERPAEEAGLDEKAALVREADRAARAAGPGITQVKILYGDSLRRVLVCNSEGTAVREERPQILLGVRAIASDGSVLQTAARSRGGRRGLEHLDHAAVAEMAAEAGESALRMLRSPRAPAGRMTVVIGGRAGGTMIHEAIGHGLEGDAAMKGLSIYSGRLGERVASELVTVVDDATIEGARGSYRFDDEGNPGRRTVAVENGVLVAFLLDRRSGARMGRPSTGNGRREDFRHRPIVRMSNTMIAPGRHDPDEIVASVRRGLYVSRMGGGQVDTSSGDFVFNVSEAFLIENGAVAGPVRGATLIGNGPAVLAAIDMVGSDLGFDIGTCGKEGQHVPVSDAQPTIRIPEITV